MWRDDLTWSQAGFLNLIWPELNKFLKGKLESIEGSEREQDMDIDRQSGVDYWWVEEGAGRTPISSRVQANDGRSGFPYNTFTIRKSRHTGSRTEYQKLTEAREHGRLYPSLIDQGYISQKSDGKLISFAIAYTNKVLDCIANGQAGERPTTNADFYYIPFKTVAHYQWPENPLKSLLTPEQLSRQERESILRCIGQAHLNPDMNLYKVNQVLAEYGMNFGTGSPNRTKDWDRFTIEQLREIKSKLT